MKIINGFPTKKSIGELCDSIGLRIYPLDSWYSMMHSIVFSKEFQNEKALKLKEVLDAEFVTEFRPANSKLAVTGQIKIIGRRKS